MMKEIGVVNETKAAGGHNGTQCITLTRTLCEFGLAEPVSVPKASEKGKRKEREQGRQDGKRQKKKK